MKIKRLLLFGLMCGILALAGCGGGGGGNAAAPQPTTATVKLSTSGTLPQGTSLSGIGGTITLPSGVTVQADASGVVSGSVVTVAGVAAPGTIVAFYIPANGTTPASVTFAMVSTAAAGFGIGEFATLTCNLASGATPTASDFSLTFQATDLSGNTVNGLTPGATVTLQ
jgi:hypothetical protein